MNSCMGGIPLGGLQRSGRNLQSNAAYSSYLPLPLILAPSARIRAQVVFSGWPAGIGPNPAVQRRLKLLSAAPARSNPTVPATGLFPISPDQERLVLPQQRSPTMSPVSGTLPRGVAIGIGLKLALLHPPRGPGLREGAGQAEGPYQCTIRLGRDCGRVPGHARPISLSPDLQDPSSKQAWEGLREGSRACPTHLAQSRSAGPQQQANLLVGASAPWWSVHVMQLVDQLTASLWSVHIIANG
ncbi:hypothetical protein MDA_GLEAN10001866 [Myotis davidii]|uniref:Uncharacterized protein n=1 Tax=Myotis davidii TaxID=225400 RepID=L5M842_MYODS|nr:hypothetical protein MDA_GLEAN10001866 [Myotis davidii]